MTTDPNARPNHSRAVEATIWGMPAVSMAAFRKSLVRDLGAGAGDIAYFSDMALPRHELLPQDKVSVSSYDQGALVANADGSLDVHIGPEAPQGLDADWIPTDGKDFWLMCRYYGPQAPLFDRSWSMYDVELVG